MVFAFGLIALVVSQLARAAPAIDPHSLSTRAGVTAVSANAVLGLTPYAQFSRAAYCKSKGITTWTCGGSEPEACDALPGFIPYLTGGNDGLTPYYFVGYWPTEDSVVVVHEGTDPTQLLSLLNDGEALFAKLDSTLFPGISTDIKVHDGFGAAQARGATTILASVKQIMAAHSTTKVTMVGHSLGAAISTIQMLYLKLNLPSTTVFKFVGHGSPRVGNKAFADYIDANFSDVTRVNHTRDLVPIVPGRFLGYHHISGETHIETDGTWVACAGQDNTDDQCSTGDVPNILVGNIIDHLGPYNGIWMGTLFCT